MKIEVANGEIVDKLTILKIKLKNSDSNLKTEQIFIILFQHIHKKSILLKLRFIMLKTIIYLLIKII